ncbi:hypothetical protein CRM22_008186 [Opisthorchis felineus]|uniref:Tc1-like transposase DDE domain-containing protein n=1 Tax=Opisthorchis felineus TaxID=147828 RepID=A0A4S2LCF7_OPIFE|nr:hypothetical protein CRM22_008186 [Opisthorchis felineus]
MNRRGILKYIVQRDVVSNEQCLQLVDELIKKLREESGLDNVVLVFDEETCHTDLDALAEKGKMTVVRLIPYLTELNPVENVWDKTRMRLKRHLQEIYGPFVRGVTFRFLDIQERLMNCLERCANRFLSSVSREQCSQMIDSILFPLAGTNLKLVITT